MDPDPHSTADLDYASAEANAYTKSAGSKRLEVTMFSIGLAMATFLSCLVTVDGGSGDFFFAIVGVTLFGAIGIFAIWIAMARQYVLPVRISNRLFIPLLGLIYFPAAHFVGCRLFAYPKYGELYAINVSVFRFIVLWLLGIAILTGMAWRRLSVGHVPWHWWLLGLTNLLSFLGEFHGMQYLGLSNTARLSHSDTPVLMQLIAFAIAQPVLVALTFSRIDRDRLARDSQQTEAENASQAIMMNEIFGPRGGNGNK